MRGHISVLTVNYFHYREFGRIFDQLDDIPAVLPVVIALARITQDSVIFGL
jgi:hypothetical protein